MLSTLSVDRFWCSVNLSPPLYARWYCGSAFSLDLFLPIGPGLLRSWSIAKCRITQHSSNDEESGGNLCVSTWSKLYRFEVPFCGVECGGGFGNHRILLKLNTQRGEKNQVVHRDAGRPLTSSFIMLFSRTIWPSHARGAFLVLPKVQTTRDRIAASRIAVRNINPQRDSRIYNLCTASRLSSRWQMGRDYGILAKRGLTDFDTEVSTR